MRQVAAVRRFHQGANRLTAIAAASAFSLLALHSVAHAEVITLDPCGICALNTTPAAGDEWVIQGGIVYTGADLSSDGALTNNASYFSNSHNLDVHAALTNNKTFVNSGRFQALGAAINNSGTLLNTGSMVATTVVNNLSGRLANAGTFDSFAYITNKALLSNTGTITLKYGMANEVGGTVNNAGTVIALQSSITNKGTFRNQNGGLVKSSSILNSGTFINEAGSTLDAGSAFFNYSGSKLVNHGTITTSDSHFELSAGSNYDFAGGKLVATNALGRLYFNRDFVFGEARAGTVEVQYGASLTNTAHMQVAKGFSQQIGGHVTNSSTGVFDINTNATLTLGDAFSNQGTLNNLGTLKVGEALISSADGGLVNKGTIVLSNSYVAASITGTGKLVQEDGHSTFGGTATFASVAVKSGQLSLIGGTINANKMTVATDAEVQNGNGTTVTVRDGLTVNGHYTFTDTGGAINGAVTNNGTVHVVEGAKAVFNGRFTNQAKFIAEGGSSAQFQDLVIGADGVIQASVDEFTVTGNLLNGSRKAAEWSTGDAKLILQGAGAHKVTLAGADLGATAGGYQNNFAWGSLTLGADGQYTLADGNTVAGGALYIGQLTLGGGLSQLASVNSPFNIYYNIGAAGNEYLEGKTYALGTGGGKLIGVDLSGLHKDKLDPMSITPSAVPEPSTWALAMGGVLVTLWRRKARGAAPQA